LITKEIIAQSLAESKESPVTEKTFPEVLAEKQKAPVTTTVETKEAAINAEVKPQATPEAVKDSSADDRIKELLKELNFNSLDELKEKVKPTPTKSKDQELSEALDFGIRNQKLKMDDYNEAVKLAAIPPKELVFKKFSENLKEKNAKISDEQIQKRFNAIYGEEVETKETDEDGNFIIQTVFDEDAIKSEAESIIKQAWQPIKNIQKDYSEYTTKEQQNAAIQKEAEALKAQIPANIKWNLGESEFEYTIDDTFRQKIQDKVIERFIATKQYMAEKGIKSDEQFDIAEATRFAVQNECFNNILLAHAATFANQRLENELNSKYKNPVTDKTLEMANQSKKVITEDPIAAADRIAGQLGRR
jgi:hypothetical protein